MFFMRNLRKYLQSDGSAGFLRAARSGHLERVLEFLKSNTDINICNTNGLNALHLASKEGHVNVVRELVNRGANTDAATKKGNTALHIASLAGQEEVVKLLVQNNATVNVQSQNGFTPLYMAAQENHDSVVRYLLANGANQSLATEDGFTPLAVALQQGHDKVVAVLLENDTKGKVRLPALHIAAKKDDTKAAALLLQNEHNPDVTSKSGFTPLHIAAHYGNENIAALLLQRGADVNYAAKHNITPLHVAAKWGKSNMVTTLLEMKANIEAKTRDGLTPLHCAARSGHDSVVDMLLVKGAPLTSKTKNGLAPLHMASQGDHVDSARILLYNKAPVDDVTVDYLTALHVAAHCGHVRVAKMLLDRQADPNSRALNGFTPLHIACKKNRIKVVELLLKHGASIEATTESGLTPLHVASFMGCMNIVIYLIQHGSNPDTPTVRGETPLHLAARANQTDIIRILLRNGAMVDARAREQQTPLHIAARLGNVDIVVLLLQHGAAVDATTKDLYTALHIAAKEGQEEVAQVLVEHQASLSATTKKGFTPLHLAAKYGNMKVAKLLLQRDAPVDAEGRNGVTPLHVAAHYDNQNVALLLLDKGASPHAAAKNGYTPLHIAAKKNQMDIATTLLEYGASTNAESRAGFTPLHLSAQEGHTDMCSLLLEHSAQANTQAKNGLTPLHLCAQEDRVSAAAVLLKAGAEKDTTTKAGYTPLHVACHFGQMNMVRFLLSHECDVNANTKLSYTPLHQAAQQGHTLIVSLLLENNASPNAVTNQGQTPLSIAQKLGYISVVETLKVVTETTITTTTTTITEEKYRVLAPETMHETFLSDSEDEGGDDFLDSGAHPTHAQHVYLPYYEGQMLLNSDDNLLGDASYKYLTADEMKSLGDDSLPIDVTKDERIESRLEQSVISDLGASPTKDELRDGYPTFTGNYQPDNVDISHTPVYSGFLVSFMVDARGGAMRGCRHSGVRVIIPPRKAASPMRITCRYLKKEKVVHPPPLMEGEALASRILEMGPSQAKFLGPVIIEVPHFASLRGKEREITILRSDNGETWREHTLEASEEAVQDVLNDSFDGEELNALEDLNTNRITRILTTDFPQYFAIVTRVRQEIHAIGPEGGMVSSTVVPQVQAVFPQGALTKKIKVGLQAQPIQAELVSKLLGNRVAVSPIVTVEPRRRKFHKPITLTIPVPQASSKGMINEYSGDAPTLRLLCSITGGPSRAQWEDVTGSTPLTFVNECVSFTTTVSARFWLIDCRNIGEANKMATELYREAIHVPFMAKFVVFSKRHDPMEAALRVFCMTDDKEDKTLEVQEHFQEVAKSRDVEVLEAKPQYVEFAGNLVPVTKSGEQLKLSFFAFRENRLPFIVRIRDLNSEPAGRIAFMREPKVGRGEPPQTPICNLNLALPAKISAEVISDDSHIYDLEKKYGRLADESDVELIHKGDLQLSDLCNLLGPDWVYLARQLEIPESDINTIEYEYHDDTAKQAQVMVRLWMTRAGNKATGNTLEKALSSIGREDIMKKCLVNVELVTDDMEKAVAETCLDQSGFDALRKEGSMRRDGSLDVSYDEQDIIKESESAEEVSSSISSSADKSSQRIIHHEEKKDKEKTPSEERAIDKDSVVVERQIVDTCVVAEEVPEHEKGAWEEPEKDVEERIVPEKRASAVVSDEDKSQRPKHELLEELGKELGRLDSSFVPKSTREHPEVVGQLAVEEEMIVKERKGAKSPTTEQIEVFPEQLDQSSSGADTSHEEAACLGESETWQSDDLEKAVNRLDTELAAQDVVAAPVPATQQTTAYPADECKFSANDLIYLEKLTLTSETQQEQSGQVQAVIGNGDMIKDMELLPYSLAKMDSDIEISPTTETMENDGPCKIENVGNEGLCRIAMRGNEPEVSHAIEYVRNDTEASQPNERMASDIEIPRRSENTGNDLETPCLSKMVGSDFEVSCATENVDNLPEVPFTIDNEGKVSKTPFTFDNEGDIPKIPFTTDTEENLSTDSCIIDNEGNLPGASYTTDIENISEILLTGVDEIHLSEVPFTSDNQGSLREAPFIIDNKGNLSEARFVIDNEGNQPEGSFTIEGDLSDVPFVFDYNGNQPAAPFTIDNEGNLHETSFTVVNEGNLQGVPFSFDNELESPFILNNKGRDISEALILDDDDTNLSHFTEQELLVHDNDMISEATQQPHENLSSGKPFQEREPWYQDFEPDDEMRDLTQRVADVASSLASTLEKLEHDSPSEQEPMERPSVPHKKEKHVRISEEDEIIYPSRGSYECDIGDEERRKVLQSFEASVEQMLLDVESEAATLPKLDQHAPLADFEQEPIIEFESYDVELPHTPELSEDEYLEHVHFPPKSLTESYSPIPCGDIIARSRSPSSPRPTSVSSESDEARPIKAEIKLLVTTREEGKEAVEIRSIREFVDAEEKSKSTFSRIVARSPTPGSEEGRTSRGADMEPRIYEQQETSGSPVESHQHTTPEGATVHTTQYTTPDGTTVRTTHTRVVSEGVSGDSDAIQQQMQEMMADVMQKQQQEH